MMMIMMMTMVMMMIVLSVLWAWELFCVDHGKHHLLQWKKLVLSEEAEATNALLMTLWCTKQFIYNNASEVNITRFCRRTALHSFDGSNKLVAFIFSYMDLK